MTSRPPGTVLDASEPLSASRIPVSARRSVSSAQACAGHFFRLFAAPISGRRPLRRALPAHEVFSLYARFPAAAPSQTPSLSPRTPLDHASNTVASQRDGVQPLMRGTWNARNFLGVSGAVVRARKQFRKRSARNSQYGGTCSLALRTHDALVPAEQIAALSLSASSKDGIRPRQHPVAAESFTCGRYRLMERSGFSGLVVPRGSRSRERRAIQDRSSNRLLRIHLFVRAGRAVRGGITSLRPPGRARRGCGGTNTRTRRHRMRRRPARPGGRPRDLAA